MTSEIGDDVPLKPLNELIWKFKKRARILTILMLFSLPASTVSIILFLVFVLLTGFSSLNVTIFLFLLFSAVASFLGNILIPDLLSGIIDQMETSAQSIAFTITKPEGKNPQERILNQLAKTDYYIKNLIKKKPKAPVLNAKVAGKKGVEYDFDVYIHNDANIIRKIIECAGTSIFAKRFDQMNLVTEQQVRNLKDAIQNVLKRIGQRIPTRVLIISISGFEDSVFEYVNSKEGIFRTKFPAFECRMELIKENTDGSFDVLSF